MKVAFPLLSALLCFNLLFKEMRYLGLSLLASFGTHWIIS